MSYIKGSFPFICDTAGFQRYPESGLGTCGSGNVPHLFTFSMPWWMEIYRCSINWAYGLYPPSTKIKWKRDLYKFLQRIDGSTAARITILVLITNQQTRKWQIWLLLALEWALCKCNTGRICNFYVKRIFPVWEGETCFNDRCAY